MDNDDDEDDDKHPKEAFYDERISPLMTQIIALCKEAKINMAAQFALGPCAESETDEPLYCTTVLDVDRDEPKEIKRILDLRAVMYPPHPSLMAFTIYGGAKR